MADSAIIISSAMAQAVSGTHYYLTVPPLVYTKYAAGLALGATCSPLHPHPTQDVALYSGRSLTSDRREIIWFGWIPHVVRR